MIILCQFKRFHRYNYVGCSFFVQREKSTLRLEAKREKKYAGYFHNAKLTELVLQDGKHGESNQTGREKKRWDLDHRVSTGIYISEVYCQATWNLMLLF